MNIFECRKKLDEMERSYELFMKQYNKSYLRGTRSEKTEQAYLDRMARLYSSAVNAYNDIRQAAFSYDSNTKKIKVKDKALYEELGFFLDNHKHFKEFTQSAIRGINMRREANTAIKQVVMANIKAKKENNVKLQEAVNENKHRIFMSSDDNTLSAEQKNGIAEFEKWLYRNCDKTGFKILSGGRSKRDFANEFVKLPARVKLNALYLLQTDKRKEAETDEDLKNSQKSFIPNLSKLKDKMIRNKGKIWTRFDGSHLMWEKLQQSISMSLDKVNELEKLTANAIDDISYDLSDLNVENDELDKNINASELFDELETLNDGIHKDVKDINGGRKVYENISADDIENEGKIKASAGLGYTGKGITFLKGGKSGFEFGYSQFKTFSDGATKGLNLAGNGASAAGSVVTIAVDGLGLSNIRERISKMGHVLKDGSKMLSDIVDRLKESNSGLFAGKKYGDEGFGIVPGDMLEKLTKEQVESLSKDDKELYKVGMELYSQVKTAKQDYEEAKRHKDVKAKMVAVDVGQAVIAGVSFIPGSQVATLPAGMIGSAYYAKLMNENEELVREDHRVALDNIIKTDERVKEAKDNLRARKENIKNSSDLKKIDKLLADDNRIKDKIRSEVVTENNFADAREWYRADKTRQIVNLMELKGKYSGTDEIKIEGLDDANLDNKQKEKKSFINTIKQRIKGNSEEMLDALNKSEKDVQKKLVEKEKISSKDIGDNSKNVPKTQKQKQAISANKEKNSF